MIERQPSRTALAVAMHRAAHQVHEAARVFSDPLALTILGLTPETFPFDRDRFQAHSRLRFFINARAEFAESALRAAVQAGRIRQAVVLGAGLDTFAYRHDYSDGLTVYEVDHPATQAWKRGRLAQAGIEAPAGAVFVPVDFEHSSLERELAAAGLDPDQPTFFTWLGVVPYLTSETVFATLRYVASLPGGAEIVFDYCEPGHLLPDDLRQAQEARARTNEQLGEPFITYFDTNALIPQLKALGYAFALPVSVKSLARRHFGDDPSRLDDVSARGGHLILASTSGLAIDV